MLDTSKLMEAVGGEGPSSEMFGELAFADGIDMPIELTDADLWANYTNPDLYEMDSRVREFIKKTRWSRERNGGYRTTASLVFAWIYGRQPTSEDSARCRMLNELLKYYCTSYTGKTTFHGRTVSRVYEFSKYACSRKRPYSLRLRLEEAADGSDPWRASAGAGKDKRRHGRRGDSEPGERADG